MPQQYSGCHRMLDNNRRAMKDHGAADGAQDQTDWPMRVNVRAQLPWHIPKVASRASTVDALL